MLDLCVENFLQRGFIAHAVFTRPLALQNVVVAIGEESVGITLQHRLQEMQRAKAIVQEDGRRSSKLTAFDASSLRRAR